MDVKPNKFRRGDTSPEFPGKVFWKFENGKNNWVTPNRFSELKERTKKTAAVYRSQANTRHRERLRTDPEYKRKQDDAITNWQRRNRPKMRAAMKRWLAKPGNREKARAATAAWVQTPEGRTIRRQVTRRYLNTSNGAIINRVRSRIAVALKKGGTKSAQTRELIGCSVEEFRTHLEAQFQDGMSWRNMGKWEIDHRTPLAAFNLADPFQQKVAFNFNNCRPVWKEVNRRKSDKIEAELFRGRDLRNANIIPFKKTG